MGTFFFTDMHSWDERFFKVLPHLGLVERKG